MTLTITDDKTLLDTLMNLIKRKQDHVKEGKEIDKLYSIYKKELQSIEGLMHKQKDGTIVIVSNMDDDHLFNTIKLILSKNGGSFHKVPEKYLTEIKKRPAVLTRVLEISTVNEEPDDDDDVLSDIMDDRVRVALSFEERMYNRYGRPYGI